MASSILKTSKLGLFIFAMIVGSLGSARAQNSSTLVLDPVLYLNMYPDLSAAFGANTTAATNHWLSYGITEGRRGNTIMNLPYYLSYNTDLTAAFGAGNYPAALNHFFTYGQYEGRRTSLEFDVKFYLNQYPDLTAAFGATGYPAAFQHWLNNGINEGRQSSANFSVQAYLNRYPDLLAAYGSIGYKAAFDHWLIYGIHEGRNPAPAPAPLGNVDGVFVQANGTYAVQGWTCSPGISTPISAQLYIAGVYQGEFSSNQYSEAAVAAACGNSGSNYRFIIPITASMIGAFPGASVTIVGVSNFSTQQTNELPNSGSFHLPLSSAPSSPLLPAAGSPATSSPIGNVDGVFAQANGSYAVQGWTCVPGLPIPISAQLYIGGVSQGVFASNQPSESAVATACGSTGSTYRFIIPITESMLSSYPGASVTIVGVSGASTTTLPNSGAFKIPSIVTTPPIGYVDGVFAQADGSYAVQGWTCSPGVSAPISAQLFLGGVSQGVFASNQYSEPAVAAACGNSGSTYRYIIPITASMISSYPGASVTVMGVSTFGATQTSTLPNSGSFHIPSPPPAPTPIPTATPTPMPTATATPAQAYDPNINPSMNPNAWNIEWGIGVQNTPSAYGNGWSFAFPVYNGSISACQSTADVTCPSVAYVVTPYTNPISQVGSITMTFAVQATSGSPVFNYNLQSSNTCTYEAHVRLLIQHINDPYTVPNYRYWSNPASGVLSADGNTVTVTVPIDPSQWSNMDGQFGNTDATTLAGFADTLANVGDIGMTFGGGCFFGHGVNVSGGTANFVLQSYSFTNP